jgi:hypothetical protein
MQFHILSLIICVTYTCLHLHLYCNKQSPGSAGYLTNVYAVLGDQERWCFIIQMLNGALIYKELCDD